MTIEDAVNKYGAVMNVTDVQRELKIGENNTRSLVRNAYETKRMFRVLKVGRQYRIVTTSFFNWIESAETAV